LHFISTKVIPAKISHDKNETQKFGSYLTKEFGTKAKVNELINSNRTIRLKKISKLGHYFPNLLFYLFNRKNPIEKPI
jgi:hypothetical protein